MDARATLPPPARAASSAPFGEHFAFQAQGEYLYFKTRQEGQFDFGLVDRIGHFQAGLFASFKHVDLAGNQNGGTLGQAASDSRLHLQMRQTRLVRHQGLHEQRVINSVAAVLAERRHFAGSVHTALICRWSIQAGVSATFGLWGNNYPEATPDILKSAVYGDRFGGTLRFIFPLNQQDRVHARRRHERDLARPRQ